MTGNVNSTTLLHHNWISWPIVALGIGNDHRGRVVYRANIIHTDQIGLYIGTKSDNTSTVEFYNNSVVAAYGAIKYDYDAFPKEQNVIVRDNILHGRIRLGANAIPYKTQALQKWPIGGNLQWPEPVNPDDSLISPDDKFRDPSFLSLDPANRDYFRPASDSPAATATSSSSSYIGALPPGPAPQESDWFTRLRERWRDALDESR